MTYFEEKYKPGMVFYHPIEDMYFIICERENAERYNILILDEGHGRIKEEALGIIDITYATTFGYVHICTIDMVDIRDLIIRYKERTVDMQDIRDLITRYKEFKKRLTSILTEQHIRTETSSYSETVNYDSKGD